MKKSLIATVVVGSVLATSALAYHPSRGSDDCQWGNKDRGHSRSFKHKRGNAGFGRSMAIMSFLRDLELSNDQRQEIHDVMMEHRKKHHKSFSSAFSNSSFDKAKYEQIAKSRFDDRRKNRAELIAKVYDVLNSSQKARLKTLIDEQDEDFKKYTQQ